MRQAEAAQNAEEDEEESDSGSEREIEQTGVVAE